MNSRALNRLLRPRSIAVIGGKFAQRAIRQCELLGFTGDIWPVHPYRDEMYSRPCYRTLRDLPGVPDAAFIAVPRDETVNVVSDLSSMGAGGAVCYASGFAELGREGTEYQLRLNEAMGEMPLIGPNCYGVLNYLDGVALWPDEQGGKRCNKGVAIISQSGNITVSLTMQRRGVPIAFLISTGNMAGVKTHDYILALLDNPAITAIGLYLEGIVDAYEFSCAAIEALNKGVPIVVLESGQSEIGANVTRTHSYSLSSNSQVSQAFYRRYGIIQVSSIPQMLETLKLVSLIPPQPNPTVASISCSGGEAALMADQVARSGLEFAQLTDSQRQRLMAVLGDKVCVANPLDYHTYIWGNQAAQTACFAAVYEGSQNMSVNIIDFPMDGICDPVEWSYVVQAIVDAKQQADGRVVAVATLHENCPLRYQDILLKHNIPPMFGMQECVTAIAASVEFASKAQIASTLVPLLHTRRGQTEITTLTEYQGKRKLREAGLAVVDGQVASTLDAAKAIAFQLGYPVVAKISSTQVIHKSEIEGVVPGLDSPAHLTDAADRLLGLSDELLIERHVSDPVVEMLVAIRIDPTFGLVMVVGAGGKLANLVEDSCVLHFPIQEAEVMSALSELKIGKLLHGFRNLSGDIDAVLQFITKLAEFAVDETNQIVEIEVNPLYVYAKGAGVTAIDVVYRHWQ